MTYLQLREWQRARAAADEFLRKAPSAPVAHMFRAYVELFDRGDVAAAQKIFDKVPDQPALEPEIVLPKWQFAMLQRDFTGAAEILAKSRAERFPNPTRPPIVEAYLQGCMSLARGDADGARPQFDRAIVEAEREVAEHPDDASRHAALGEVYAFVARKDDAIREGRRAVELKPESKDAMLGSLFAANLALIYARTGEADQAMTLLERLITTPGAVWFSGASVTLQELRLSWQWDPLRSHLRFKALVEGPEPKTVYR